MTINPAASVFAFAALAACTATEMEALVEDPSAFSCRERAASLMSVPFNDTVARPLRTDLFGTRYYEATAAGQRFECVLDGDGVISRFSRA